MRQPVLDICLSADVEQPPRLHVKHIESSRVSLLPIQPCMSTGYSYDTFWSYSDFMNKTFLATIVLLAAACAPRTALPPASPLDCAQGGKYTCQEAKEQAHQLRPAPSESPTLH
jgi:hypothetical protein